MKKKSALIAAVAALTVLIILSSVLIKVNRDRRYAEALEASVDAVVISSDKTVFPGFIYNTDSISYDSIIGEKRMGSYPGPKPGLKELRDGSSDVVRGTVVSLSYTFIDGLAYTQVDLCLDEVLKGSLEKDYYISVYFPGGYASVEDYNEFYGEDKPGGANKYYHFVSGPSRLPYQDDELLLFISPAADSLLPGGAYELSFGEYSVYNVLEEGTLLMQNENYMDYSKMQAIFN